MNSKTPFNNHIKKRPQEGLSTVEQGFWLLSDKTRLNSIKIAAIGVLLFAYSCASVQTPTGGPQDTNPPKLLKATPKNLTTNFTAQEIVLEFDEFIQLQNEFKEISISPEMERPPLTKAKGRSLEIDFQDPLTPNTTYTLNFGNSIADVNERNILKNFTYVFSTGPQLDSLSISGKVRNAFTALPEKDILVFIIPVSADTTFGKKKPSIFSRTDTAGNYKLSNLRSDQYRVYALKDDNGDKFYQQGTELIGFQANPINLNSPKQAVDFGIFKELPAIMRVLDRKIGADGTIQLTFNRPINNPSIVVDQPAWADATKLVRFTPTRDSVRVWLNDMRFDTLKLSVKEQDTVLQQLSFGKNAKEVYTSTLQASDNLEGGDRVNPANPLQLYFPLPIKTVQKSNFVLVEDSILRTNFTAQRDSLNFLALNIIYPWKERSKYELRINDGAVTTIGDTKNKYFVKRFQRSSANDYGTMDMTVNIPDSSTNLVFELIDDSKNLVFSRSIKKDTTFAFKNYRVGKYYARIIFDENNDGKWSGGSLKDYIQPEIIWYDPRTFPVRSNWMLKYSIDVQNPVAN